MISKFQRITFVVPRALMKTVYIYVYIYWLHYLRNVHGVKYIVKSKISKALNINKSMHTLARVHVDAYTNTHRLVQLECPTNEQICWVPGSYPHIEVVLL